MSNELIAIEMRISKLQKEFDAFKVSANEEISSLGSSEYGDVKDISELKKRLDLLENKMNAKCQQMETLEQLSVKMQKHILDMAEIISARLKNIQPSPSLLSDDTSEFEELNNQVVE